MASTDQDAINFANSLRSAWAKTNSEYDVLFQRDRTIYFEVQKVIEDFLPEIKKAMFLECEISKGDVVIDIVSEITRLTFNVENKRDQKKIYQAELAVVCSKNEVLLNNARLQRLNVTATLRQGVINWVAKCYMPGPDSAFSDNPRAFPLQ